MSGFEGFRESPDAPFYRSGGMTPEATWAEAAVHLARVIEAVRAKPRIGAPMSVDRICRWHRAIFLTTFEREAGRLRGDGEPVWFAIVVETPGGPGSRPIKGVQGRPAIARELGVACERFNTAHAALANRQASSRREALRAAAELYADLLRVHPFIDGNLRAGFVTLQAALHALYLPGVVFDDLARHDEAIAPALVEPTARSFTRLVELLGDLTSV